MKKVARKSKPGASRASRPVDRAGRKPIRGAATYRLDVEYDGTGYRGWQIQQNARSVAGELSRAIREAGGDLRELGGSGRTDAGVHALGQVAHLRLKAAADPERLQRGINDALPPGIHVTGLMRAADTFHARHDAVRRNYLYQIALRPTAFSKRFVWWVRDRLDAAAMVSAAQCFVGRHDFRLFCEQPRAQPSTIVVVDEVRIVEVGGLLLVRLSASHFLWKMVRRLVGSLVQVGTARMAPQDLARLLTEPAAAPAESPVRSTAPPSGLFLERVEYPGEPPPGEVIPAFPLGGPGPTSPRFAGAPPSARVKRGSRA